MAHLPPSLSLLTRLRAEIEADGVAIVLPNAHASACAALLSEGYRWAAPHRSGVRDAAALAEKGFAFIRREQLPVPPPL